MNFEQIYTEGITKIDTTDFAYAKKLNAIIKLVGSAVRENGRVAVSVCPKLIPEDNPLYGVSGMLYGSGAGKLPTASAVLADIIEAAKNMDRNVPFGWHEGQTVPEPMEDSLHRYLIRFKGSDSAKAKAVFADAEAVSPDGEAAGEEFALFTGVMREKDMQAAAAQFDNIIKVIRA